ncbi:hypothetical protein SAMN00777080_0613 [Aquiflexum balticum DSM 16537]|uniref:Uncharacterized protein n=1 Tax=Aquiflexum balticum DSM 16537 TaxID=758820 RepID=A0A1W2H0Q2_9BACT|nr:hypothetical protein [Aquiflexum balticum]SMD42076.1 hypothetical protein SAMN00777080_0613 [Aquiflexum balticum DSM 16537]
MDIEPACTFYSVKWLDEDFTETDKFILKYKDKTEFSESLQALASFITDVIGEDGAYESYFRFENDAHAIPPSGIYQVGEIEIDYRDFKLRLYCLRICESIVVLFNGAEKTSQKAQDGNTSMVFYEANMFAQRILKAIIKREILIDTENARILSDTGNSTEIIL